MSCTYSNHRKHPCIYESTLNICLGKKDICFHLLRQLVQIFTSFIIANAKVFYDFANTTKSFVLFFFAITLTLLLYLNNWSKTYFAHSFAILMINKFITNEKHQRGRSSFESHIIWQWKCRYAKELFLIKMHLPKKHNQCNNYAFYILWIMLRRCKIVAA